MPPLPEVISDDLVDFLKLCFVKDPRARPAAVVMFEHPWVKKLNPEMVCASMICHEVPTDCKLRL